MFNPRSAAVASCQAFLSSATNVGSWHQADLMRSSAFLRLADLRLLQPNSCFDLKAATLPLDLRNDARIRGNAVALDRVDGAKA